MARADYGIRPPNEFKPAVSEPPHASGGRGVFHGIGPADGQITLTIGEVKLDPAWLNPEHWITPQTTVFKP